MAGPNPFADTEAAQRTRRAVCYAPHKEATLPARLGVGKKLNDRRRNDLAGARFPATAVGTQQDSEPLRARHGAPLDAPSLGAGKRRQRGKRLIPTPGWAAFLTRQKISRIRGLRGPQQPLMSDSCFGSSDLKHGEPRRVKPVGFTISGDCYFACSAASAATSAFLTASSSRSRSDRFALSASAVHAASDRRQRSRTCSRVASSPSARAWSARARKNWRFELRMTGPDKDLGLIPAQAPLRRCRSRSPNPGRPARRRRT